MNYIQISVTANEAEKDIAIAQLSSIGFDAFEEVEHGVDAFITEDNFNSEELETLASDFNLSYTINIIPNQNWNALWESNFSPVVVDDFAVIRANFHAPITNVEHEIIINPKMSFGTGHHATTFMMMQLMQHIDFTNKSVFDFGSGTGILAILAEKLTAATILAVDNDDNCIENAEENIVTNHCNHIQLAKANTAKTNQQFDIILANINKNIITDNFPVLYDAVVVGGTLLLSGLLASDKEDIVELAESYQLKLTNHLQKDNWIALQFFK